MFHSTRLPYNRIAICAFWACFQTNTNVQIAPDAEKTDKNVGVRHFCKFQISIPFWQPFVFPALHALSEKVAPPKRSGTEIAYRLGGHVTFR
jgi:hypothetical protein